MNKAVKTVSFIVVATFLSKLMGLFRDILVANYYGTGVLGTAFLNASTIPVAFFDLTLGAAILSSFIPVFNGFLQRGEKEKAFEFSNSFINLVFLITVVFSVVGSLFPHILVNIVASGIGAHAKDLTSQLLIILLPTTIFTGLAYSVVGILQSFDEFNIPAIISLVSNLIVIAYLLLFNGKFGVYGLAISMLIGWSMQLFVQIPALIKKGYRYRFTLNFKNDGIKDVAKLSLPILIASWVQPITVLINKNFASYLYSGSGSAALDYANRLYIIVVGVFAFAITNYIFPSMSRFGTDGDKEQFSKVLKSSIKTIVLITVPIFLGMMLLSKEIITIVYARGEFDELSVKLCSGALFFYSMGMVSYGYNEIVNKCFYALKKAKVPMIASVLGIGLTAVLSFAFMKYTEFGVNGLALSSSVGLIFVSVILSVFVNREFYKLIDGKLLFGILKIFVCGLVMFAVGFLVKTVTAGLGMILSVVMTVIVCAIVYFALLLLIKNEELLQVINKGVKK